MARLEPLIPAASPGRPTTQNRHAGGNERHFYLLRTGCPWRGNAGGFPSELDLSNDRGGSVGRGIGESR
jgi:transposase